MCGLVGVAGNLATKDEGLIKRLLLFDSLRGMDSTGMAAITLSGEAKIAKVPDHPLGLFENVRFRSILNGNSSCVFLGHNRAQTRGVISHANAHPFDCGHIIGAHNGTLEWASHSDIEKKLGVNFSVDSLALMAAIEEFGVEEAMSLARGSWTIVYINLKDGTLNFLSNGQRPMWLSYTKDFNRIIWASEWKMIDASVNLGGYGEDLWTDEKGNGYFQLEDNVHYSFSIDALRKGGTKRPKPVVKKVEGSPERPFELSGNFSHKGGSDPFKRDYKRTLEDLKEECHRRTTSTTQSKTSSNPPVVILQPSKNDPYCKLISEAQFEECLSNNAIGERGCSFCGTPIEYGTQGIALWVRDKKILCPKHAPKTRGESRTRIYLPPARSA